jgi:hypothetical protein
MSESKEVPDGFVKRIEVLSLKPGDILVLYVPEGTRWPRTVMGRLSEGLRGLVPEGVKTAIVPCDLRLERATVEELGAAGKTAAACAIVSRMRHRGLVVHAFKATGVSLRRDILAMEDSGARRSMIFTDLGIVTTTAACGPALTRTMLTEMTQGRPDVVVFELGDGILGAYGVEAILAENDIRQALTAVVLSANDPVAAWGGVKLLRERFQIEPCAVTGPATDNAVGVNIIQDQMGVRAVNAMASGAALGDHLIESLGLGAKLARAASE